MCFPALESFTVGAFLCSIFPCVSIWCLSYGVLLGNDIRHMAATLSWLWLWHCLACNANLAMAMTFSWLRRFLGCEIFLVLTLTLRVNDDDARMMIIHQWWQWLMMIMILICSSCNFQSPRTNHSSPWLCFAVAHFTATKCNFFWSLTHLTSAPVRLTSLPCRKPQSTKPF